MAARSEKIANGRPLIELLVQVNRVGGQQHLAAGRRHEQPDLAGRVAGKVDRHHSGCQFVAVVEGPGRTLVQASIDQREVIGLGMLEEQHVATARRLPERGLAPRDPQVDVGERGDVAGVVVVQMGQHDERRRHAEALQRGERRAQRLAAPAAADVGIEPRVDEDHRRLVAQDPEVVVEALRPVGLPYEDHR